MRPLFRRVAFASIAGGAASYLSGGKVGAGMVSAAFSQYWNGEMHRDRIKRRQPSLTPAQSAEGFHNAADIVSNSLLVASASSCFLICASLSAVVDWVSTSVYALNGDYWSAGANLIPGFAGDAVKHTGKLSGVVLPKENLIKIGAEVGTNVQMDQDYMRTRYYEESTYSGK